MYIEEKIKLTRSTLHPLPNRIVIPGGRYTTEQLMYIEEKIKLTRSTLHPLPNRIVIPGGRYTTEQLIFIEEKTADSFTSSWFKMFLV